MKLALQNIGHAFLGRTIFEGIDLTLEDSEVTVLLGPSGCGKTTLLQIAAGLTDQQKGFIKRQYRRHAVVFQEHRLLPWMTARDNIVYGLRISGERESLAEIAERRAREIGLLPKDLDKYPAELSGGMRQRVAVARALAVDPDMVFFDEPFSAADVGLRRVLQDLVITAAARERFSALFVTHDLTEAVRIGHRLVVLSGEPGSILVDRRIPGEPGSRSDRQIFDIVEEWSREPEFEELFDGERDLRA